MKLQLNCRRHAGSVVLGIFVIVIVTVFLLGVWTIASRASRIKPRQIDYEQTNSFWSIDRRDTVYASPPGQPDPPAFSSIKTRNTAGLIWISHTNQLVFKDSEDFTNAWLIVERTQDWTNWTILQWVMFDRAVFTNGMIYQTFVDVYAPTGQSFYRGIIHP